ncbi:MAG: hypothetical protein GVY22_06495 [Gammaproteobacteria bacterium]|jgi:hypothetical protein|nr:hypothetical protein [Gammaproteobacteria bacterium]
MAIRTKHSLDIALSQKVSTTDLGDRAKRIEPKETAFGVAGIVEACRHQGRDIGFHRSLKVTLDDALDLGQLGEPPQYVGKTRLMRVADDQHLIERAADAPG